MPENRAAEQREAEEAVEKEVGTFYITRPHLQVTHDRLFSAAVRREVEIKRLVDGAKILARALSRIDYACGEKNDMECSLYDVDCDEERVVGRVQSLLAERDKEVERLKAEIQIERECDRDTIS